jgi:hypothetical protein
MINDKKSFSVPPDISIPRGQTQVETGDGSRFERGGEESPRL